VCAVIALAVPLWLGGLSARAAKWTASGPLSRVRRLPKLGGSDVRDRRANAENPAYRAVPTRALGQLVEFMRVVDDELPAVAAPVLVVHARQDHTAPVECAARIAGRTRARRIRLLDASYHLISVDVEKDLVAAECTTFLEQTCAT
jgi:carboxylesterase